eukprot:242323_1
MAQQAAKEYTTCCVCDFGTTEVDLYICTKKDCPKFGDIFCEGCGQRSHRSKKIKHSFEIGQDHIKLVDPSVIDKYVNDGLRLVRRTLARHKDKQLETRRVMIEAAASGGGMMGVISLQLAESAFSAGSMTVAAGVLGGATGAIGGIFIAAQETIIHTMRFMRGEIKTWKEYGYHMAKGWTTAAGCSLGGWGGAAAGAAIGVVGGPIGVIIGAVIGAIAGGLLGAKLSRSAFELCFPGDQFDNEQIGRREMIMDSLKLFGFTEIKDIEDPDIFNEVEVKRTYRELARRYHPDRNEGSAASTQKFQEINAAFGVLLQLLNTKDKGYVIKRMTQIKAIKWRSDIEELRQLLVEGNVMYIVNICTQWDNRVTLEKIASWRKHDILEFIKTLNEDGGNNHEISVIDRNEFADAIAGWNGTANENDHFFRNKPNEDSGDSKDTSDNDEAEVATDPATELMNDLMNELKKGKLLDLVQICQEFDEEYCLESLLEYTKKDILEVINEVNADETNNHKISVGRKNKFAKIISNFAAQ